MHCWLMFHLVPTRTPQVLFCQLLPGWMLPSIYWYLGFLPRWEALHFLLNYMSFLSDHFSSLLWPLNASMSP